RSDRELLVAAGVGAGVGLVVGGVVGGVVAVVGTLRVVAVGRHVAAAVVVRTIGVVRCAHDAFHRRSPVVRHMAPGVVILLLVATVPDRGGGRPGAGRLGDRGTDTPWKD